MMVEKVSTTWNARSVSSDAVGFVGQHDAWLVDQRTGNRHTLLLAAGELPWQVVHPVAQAQALHRS